MKAFRKAHNGFTLVELLVVTAIIGIVIGSVYSLYLTQLKSAYQQDEALDVQQNLRLAMDAITKDLRMAGMLVPISGTITTPLSAISNNYSTSVQINTRSPEGIYSRITVGQTTAGSSSNFLTTVDSADAVNSFIATLKPTDRIRIVRPFDNSLPMGPPSYATYTSFSLDLANTNTITPQISITRNGGTIAAGIVINPGDMFAKGAGTGATDSIVYSIVTGGNCPAGSCLGRQVNPPSPLPAPTAAEIVASNLSRLRFSYIYDVGNESNAPASFQTNTIKAVRVTINGATTATLHGDAAKYRQVTSVIALRNRRAY